MLNIENYNWKKIEEELQLLNISNISISMEERTKPKRKLLKVKEILPSNSMEHGLKYHSNYWVKTNKGFVCINICKGTSKYILELVEHIEEGKTRSKFWLYEKTDGLVDKPTYIGDMILSIENKQKKRLPVLQGIWDGSMIKIKSRKGK